MTMDSAKIRFVSGVKAASRPGMLMRGSQPGFPEMATDSRSLSSQVPLQGGTQLGWRDLVQRVHNHFNVSDELIMMRTSS